MSKYILKYSRDSRVKYISHLDFIRLFHRAVRRSGVKFMFSRGFNPHPKMTVAMPLSVGVTSDSEYMKVEFTDDYSPEEIKDRINSSFPPGFKILSVTKLLAKEIDLTKIHKSTYTVDVELPESSKIPDISEFLSNKELIVMKKTKSGEKPSDIRPYIFELSLNQISEKIIVFKMCLSCGNDYNLKPDTVIAAMVKYCDGFYPTFYSVHRNELIL